MEFKKNPATLALIASILVVILGGAYYIIKSSQNNDLVAAKTDAPNYNKVTFNKTQVKSLEINPVGSFAFSQQRTAVGNIDFNENLNVPVFAPYQGKIIKVFVDIGDNVLKGAPLYSINSADLLQAESTLIAASGVYTLTTSALARAKDLHANQGLSQKDMEQAVSDQQTADAALKAAREAVRIFGKTDADIKAIETTKKVDGTLIVTSPITGRVTARTAQTGLLVQPTSTPAPIAVADLSTMWMVANVTESDSPLFKAGQIVKVKIAAFADREFTGKVAVVGATVDPVSRTVMVRSELADPKHELRPGMFATYVIHTGDAIPSLAIPQTGVVREGDGSMSIWVTKDRKTFEKRTVKIGLQEAGLSQILSGINQGEIVVTKGAIFLSNMANANTAD